MTDTFRTGLVANLPHLQRYARSLARTSSAADDLVQDTMLRAMEKEHLFDGTNLRGWLCRMARNIWFDRHRRAMRFPSVGIDDAIEVILPVAPPSQEKAIELAEICARFDDLSEGQKICIYGIARGNSYERIAEVAEVPLGTVRSRLVRSRRRLMGDAA